MNLEFRLKNSHRSIKAMRVHVRRHLFLIPKVHINNRSCFIDDLPLPDYSNAGAELREVLAGSAEGGEGVIVCVVLTPPVEIAEVVEPDRGVVVKTGEVVNHEGLAVIETLFHCQFILVGL